MRKASRLQPLARAVLRTQSDERLVALSREGHDAAFEEVVRRYRPGLVAFAAAYAPPGRAEDVVQESFIRSWDALRRSTEEIRLKPWLYTIVRNRALNARRDARPETALPDELDDVRGPAEIALTNEELARVVSAVGELPEPQREALVRSAIEGHTHEQIAASIGSSPGAVRQLIYRARLAVREGVGFVIPLPLVRMLLETGTGETVATAAAGGAAVAGTVGGASMLSKATVVAVVGTIAAASGVAIKRAADEPSRAEAPIERSTAGSDGASQGSASGVAGSDSSGPSASSGPGGGSGSSGPGGGGDDNSGPGGGDDDGADDRSGDGGGDSSGPSASSGPGSGEVETDDDSSGPGSGDEDPVETEDHSGPGHGGSESSGSGSSGSGHSGSGSSGSGSSGSGSSGSGSSGSGSSGSGSSGSGSSGSGSSGSGSDSSGSGSSGSGSDSSGSGSSGSGSGSNDEPVEPEAVELD